MKSIVERALDVVSIAKSLNADFLGDSVVFAQALLDAVEALEEIELNLKPGTGWDSEMCDAINYKACAVLAKLRGEGK